MARRTRLRGASAPKESDLVVYARKTSSQDIASKVGMRRQALAEADPESAIFMPFSGYGELGKLVPYPPGRIYGCDIKKAAALHCRTAFPGSHMIRKAAEQFPFPSDVQFGYADFDAYNNPFRAVMHFMKRARFTEKVEVILTVSIRIAISRRRRRFSWRAMELEPRLNQRAAHEQLDKFRMETEAWMRRYGGILRLHKIAGRTDYFWFTCHPEKGEFA